MHWCEWWSWETRASSSSATSLLPQQRFTENYHSLHTWRALMRATPVGSPYTCVRKGWINLWFCDIFVHFFLPFDVFSSHFRKKIDRRCPYLKNISIYFLKSVTTVVSVFHFEHTSSLSNNGSRVTGKSRTGNHRKHEHWVSHFETLGLKLVKTRKPETKICVVLCILLLRCVPPFSTIVLSNETASVERRTTGSQGLPVPCLGQDTAHLFHLEMLESDFSLLKTAAISIDFDMHISHLFVFFCGYCAAKQDYGLAVGHHHERGFQQVPWSRCMKVNACIRQTNAVGGPRI